MYRFILHSYFYVLKKPDITDIFLVLNLFFVLVLAQVKILVDSSANFWHFKLLQQMPALGPEDNEYCVDPF